MNIVKKFKSFFALDTSSDGIASWMSSGYVDRSLTEKDAMSVSAVHACVELISGSIASMPLHFYRRGESGRERYTPEVWWLLNERPHTTWGAHAFWSFMTMSKLLHGDAFAIIHRQSPFSPLVRAFEPVHPQSVLVEKKADRLRYTVYKDDKTYVYDQDDILHFTGVGFDGTRGVSQIKYVLSHPAGIALAADEHSANFFKNGARPDFVIEFPGNLTEEQKNLIRTTWVTRHQGTSKSNLPAVVSGGAKIHPLTMNADDAQLIATRGFQVEDIARIFGVPPHMIGHTEKTTSWGSGVEQMSIGFVKFTLQRHLCAFEQEINAKLFRTARSFCEFSTAGLERGDIKTRYESYRIGLGRAGEQGWMSLNEIRRLENLPPLDGGDSVQKEEIKKQ